MFARTRKVERDETRQSTSGSGDDRPSGDAAGGIADFTAGAAPRGAGPCSVPMTLHPTPSDRGLPYGSDPDEPFIEVVWWVNEELLHYGAEIALIRNLYRAGCS